MSTQEKLAAARALFKKKAEDDLALNRVTPGREGAHQPPPHPPKDTSSHLHEEALKQNAGPGIMDRAKDMGRGAMNAVGGAAKGVGSAVGGFAKAHPHIATGAGIAGGGAAAYGIHRLLQHLYGGGGAPAEEHKAAAAAEVEKGEKHLFHAVFLPIFTEKLAAAGMINPADQEQVQEAVKIACAVKERLRQTNTGGIKAAAQAAWKAAGLPEQTQARLPQVTQETIQKFAAADEVRAAAALALTGI